MSNLKEIWNIKIPLKFLLFNWLSAQNSILTLDNLIKRGKVIPNICILCKQDNETVDHLLFSCNYTIQIWEKLLEKFKLNLDINTDINKPLNIILDPTIDKKTRAISSIFMHNIWKHRCEKIFQGKNLNIFQLLDNITKEIGEIINDSNEYD